MKQAELFTSQTVRELDQHLLAREGITAFELMQRAAQAAFATVLSLWPNAQRLLVVAGAGNNGGDAWLVAKLAKDSGFAVQLYYLGEPKSVEAKQAQQAALAAGVAAQPFTGALAEADLIVDGLLGIGLAGEVQGQAAALISAMNSHGAPTFALDLPSGLNADTGAVLGVAVSAHTTLAFVAYKQGQFTLDGPDHCGQLLLADLQAKPYYSHFPASALAISSGLLNERGYGLPPRKANSHKGLFGHVLMLGGDLGMGGALSLAVESCLRSGAGLLSCATRVEHVPVILARTPEAMVRAVRSALEASDLIEKASVLAIGPGLGQGSWAQLLLQAVLGSNKPAVLDADALNLLAQPAWQHSFSEREVVLTPHPAEAARLLGISTQEVQQDRFAAVRALAQKYQAVVVLKGCGSLIARPQQEAVALCGAGNAGMSTGGMGDVLTGIVAGLMAQGLNAWQAACLAVCVHAEAGDRCAQKNGSRGMLASDLAPHVQELLN